MVLSLALIILSPRSRILEPGLRPFATRQAEVPIEVRDAVTARGIYCNADNETLFRWSGAVTGLPGILSRNPADCR